MSNDYAKIRRDIWGDTEWRTLSRDAQWLYLAICSAPSLSFCGVADWRPNRMAKLVAGTTVDDITSISVELIDHQFVLPDFETEEILVRSWVKHDGLMKNPNMAKAMRNAWDEVTSRALRGVIVDQLNRLHDNNSSFKGWGHVGNLLRQERLTFDEALQMVLPSPTDTPSVSPSILLQEGS